MTNKRKYSNNQINRAGKDITKENLEDDTLDIVNYWRRLHARPLVERYEKLNNLIVKNSITATSVGRLKRRQSIIAKLERIYNWEKLHMKLARM